MADIARGSARTRGVFPDSFAVHGTYGPIMADAQRTRYVAECFWAGVREQDLRDLDQRIDASITESASPQAPVRYLGRLLVFDDEVVLVVFEGPADTVRRVAEHADVPFERLLRVSYAPRPPEIAVEEVPE